MAPLDPQQLLRALNELLGPKGEIAGCTEAVRVASLMKDANKLVSKCVYINILKVETSKDVLEKLISSGGWDTLNKWLQETKDDDNYPFLVEILKVYHTLPVTVDILKTNNAAKTIKQLCKSDNENVKTLATNIFDEWMKKVKGNNNNNDDKSKKKKKDKVRDKDSEKRDGDKSEKKDGEKSSKKYESDSSSSSSKSDSKSRSRDSKHSHHHHSYHDKDRDRERRSSDGKKDREQKMEAEDMDTSSNDSNTASSDDKVVVRKGDGLKLHIRLGGDKDKSNKSEESVQKRPSTVKRPPIKFRSTGLEEETVPVKLPKNADLSKPIPKRTGSDIKSELPIKRSRPNMPPPLSVPTVPVTSSGPTSTSPQSPGEIHGKIKLIPARPKSNHEIHESSGFMDSLTTSSRVPVSFKKKRRLSGHLSTPPSSKGPAPPSTPPSPISPTAAIAKSLPSVPSFYKETQETEPSPEKEIKTERSPSPDDEITGQDIKSENTEADSKTKDIKTERSPSPTEIASTNSNKESKGLLTTGATKVKRKRKSVTWKPDHEIKEIFYFEMDEDERVNVNRPKDFNQAKRDEMIQDRRAFESSIRMKNDRMMEQLTWYRPKVVNGYKVFEYGKESVEKGIQKIREQSVLQALFFNKNMIPDNPQEPDMENVEPEEPKMIPVDDMSGGEEFLYNYETHPQAIQQKAQEVHVPVESTTPAQFNQPLPPPQQPPQQLAGPLGLNLPPGVQLPPDLANILSQIQSNPSNNNDPVIAHVQQILNNLMCGGTDQSYEQLQQIQQMMNSQMGMPPDGMMQGPPPNMQMMGMNPGGPPMGPRTLLGAGPPGFLNQRQMGPGPGPNRFGPPGPGPQGNWGPPGNMGGPNSGPQGNFGGGGGRMRGLGPGRGARGGRGKSRSVLCRHFANGSCRIGNSCSFLHPGVNGPPLDDQQNMNQSINS
ncbi:hypothetical protein ACF0H5_021342 [Mactra antiquata]